MNIITDLKDPSKAMKKFLSVKIIFSDGVKMHSQNQCCGTVTIYCGSGSGSSSISRP